MRLAYIQDPGRHAPALPIIMDEVLVNFDSERATRAMRAFARLVTGEIPHQILYFTCHPQMAAELVQSVPCGVLYEIKQGKIMRA